MRSLAEVDFAQPSGFRPLSMDVRTPDAQDVPIVVFLHGGGWMRGSRKVFTPGLSDAQSFDRIVAAGFAVASCEYRLSGEARFPSQLEDVDAALAWIREHGSEYGVDSSRVVLWGVSAGATLAALSALRRDDITAVVDWFGPADLIAMADHDIGDTVTQTREARWLGAPAVEVPEVARAASPVLQVRHGAPPFHIAHGTADAHVPISQSAMLARALEEAGADVEFVEVRDGRHFWQGVADTAPLFDSALRFIRRTTS